MKTKRNRRHERGTDVRAPRFEYCCGAMCDEGCRREAMHEALLRRSPLLGLRVG